MNNVIHANPDTLQHVLNQKINRRFRILDTLFLAQ